jgi:outer membrane protein TolC
MCTLLGRHETAVRSLLRSNTPAILSVGLFASVMFTPAAAQTVRLEDVVAGALSNSTLIQRDDERVRRAAGQLQQAQGAFDWSVNAETGWQQLYVPKARNGLLTDQLDTPTALSTVVGIGRRFRNGIEVQPGVSFYANTDASAAQVAGLNKPRPALNLSIPLFRGRGSDNSFATGERAAAASLEGSAYNRDFTVQKAVHDAVQVYWRCLALRQHLTVLDADQHAAQDYLSSLRSLVQRGQIEPTLLERAVANVAVQRVGLSRAVTADQNCRHDLAVAMGKSPDSSRPTAVGEFPAMDGMAESVDRLSQQRLTDIALANRHDLMGLMRYDAAENERVRGARNSLQPKVDIYVDPSKILLRYSRSIGRDTEQGQVTAATAAQNEARLNLEQAQTQVRVDIDSQLRGLKDAMTDWTSLMQSVGLLENVVSDAQRRADAGVISQQEYRVAQNELVQVRGQVIDAKLQYAASLAGLRLATGTIDAGDGGSAAGAAAGFRSLPDR